MGTEQESVQGNIRLHMTCPHHRHTPRPQKFFSSESGLKHKTLAIVNMSGLGATFPFLFLGRRKFKGWVSFFLFM